MRGAVSDQTILRDATMRLHAELSDLEIAIGNAESERQSTRRLQKRHAALFNFFDYTIFRDVMEEPSC